MDRPQRETRLLPPASVIRVRHAALSSRIAAGARSPPTAGARRLRQIARIRLLRALCSTRPGRVPRGSAARSCRTAAQAFFSPYQPPTGLSGEAPGSTVPSAAGFCSSALTERHPVAVLLQHLVRSLMQRSGSATRLCRPRRRRRAGRLSLPVGPIVDPPGGVATSRVSGVPEPVNDGAVIALSPGLFGEEME